MRFKLKLASGIAVAATLATALAATSGSGALAEDFVPIAVTEMPVANVKDAPPTFVSEPVVQAVPAQAEREPAEISEPEASEEIPDQANISAKSLSWLVSKQPKISQLSRDMHCLAGAIYFESRGESLNGQLAVGRVVVERAGSHRFPDSYCGVVFQRSQFSFVRGGRMPTIRKSSAAWKRAKAIARIADEGSWESPAKGALFFHATYVSPGWKLKRLARVDKHIFYR